MNRRLTSARSATCRSSRSAQRVAHVLQTNWNFRSLRVTTEAMKDDGTIAYPDVSDILARKTEGRRDISRRSFGAKIAMVEQLRERLAPLKRAREQRMAGQDRTPDVRSGIQGSGVPRRG